jgi:hemerythrin
MAYFEWADDMVIDEGPIDADHQHLVKLVNALHTATSQGCGQEVVGHIMDDLLAYTQAHLQREEQIMASLKFPKLSGHQQGHHQFVAALQAIHQRYQGGSITTASQLSTLLRDWLSLHIRRADRELREFMSKQTR